MTGQLKLVWAGLRALLPALSDVALKTLLSRAVSEGHLARVCRGIYLYERVDYPRGLVLFHAAARLRASTFNYRAARFAGATDQYRYLRHPQP